MDVLEPVTETISIIDEEIELIKSIVDSTKELHPMVVFYSSSTNRQLVVACPLFSETADNIQSISEIMTLYPVLGSHAAVIVLPGKAEVQIEELANSEDENFEVTAINIFVVSYDYAYSIVVPYQILEEDHPVIWLDNCITVENIMDQIEDYSDSDVFDLVSMMYTFTHVHKVHFTFSELLSYFSTKSYCLNVIDPLIKIPDFFDFSDNNLIALNVNQS